MNADDIRAEAIVRIASAAQRRRAVTGEPVRIHGGDLTFGEVVDALGDLLPTGIEWGAGEVEDHTTDRVRTVPHDICENEAHARHEALYNGESVMQRYIHDWRVTE